MMSILTLMNDGAQVSAAVSDLEDIDRLLQTYRLKMLASASSWLRDMGPDRDGHTGMLHAFLRKVSSSLGSAGYLPGDFPHFLRTRVPCIRSGAMLPSGICNAVSDDSMPFRSCVRGSTPGRGAA
jgi:hypothetical protein